MTVTDITGIDRFHNVNLYAHEPHEIIMETGYQFRLDPSVNGINDL